LMIIRWGSNKPLPQRPKCIILLFLRFFDTTSNL